VDSRLRGNDIKEKLFLKNLAEVGILQNNHLQTGWGMSTSPTAILTDFDDIATSIIRIGLEATENSMS